MQGKSEPNRELLDAAALCGLLVPEGSVHAFLASHRESLFPGELFEDLVPSAEAGPSVPANVVATVMVLQALEGLSDRDAVRKLPTNIAWKQPRTAQCFFAQQSPNSAPAAAQPPPWR